MAHGLFEKAPCCVGQRLHEIFNIPTATTTEQSGRTSGDTT